MMWQPMTPDRQLNVLRDQNTAGILQRVTLDELRDVTSKLINQQHARIADLFGVDVSGRMQLHLILAIDARGEWRHLITELPQGDASFASLTAISPAADWYEREIWSELGITPMGSPGIAALRLPVGWPSRVYPLLGGLNGRDPFTLPDDNDGQELEAAPEGVVDYPLGPIRSGIVESGHYLLRTVGEEIVDIRLRLFYKHRGIEVLAAGLGPLHLPLLAERISGTDAFNESLALCHALETMVGIECPPRAAALRTLFAELERLYNHFGYQADLCQATGLVVAQAQFDILKEKVLRLNARIAGHRYLFGLNVPGGLSRDLQGGDAFLLRDQLRQIHHDFAKIAHLAFATSSHLDRLEGTGILQAEDAAAYATVGPIGRASAQDRDLRRDFPYAAYREADFSVPVEPRGDALARARVRLEETYQSLRIAAQVLDHLPTGQVSVPVSALPACANALGWAESSRGETLHVLFTDEQGVAYRYRVRTGSFANWQAFPLAVPGHNILTDFPIIEQSFGLSYAGNDR